MPVTFIQSGRFAAAGGYDADASALFARWGTDPGSTRKQLYSDCIAGLKSDSVWSLIDEVQLYGAHTQADGLLGWKNVVNATLVNSPTFTTDRGVAGDGSTSYINTGFQPSTLGVNYTTNSACFGAYFNAGTDTADNAAIACGCSDGSDVSRFYPRRVGDTIRFGVNQATGASDTTGTVATRLGLTMINRSGASAVEVYRNGSAVTLSATPASTGDVARPFFVGAHNNNSVAAGFVNNRAALFVATASLDATKQTAIYSRFLTLLTAIGAN